MRWPADFMWGTAASSTQCEGAAPASDWWDWERAGHAPISGDGNGFAARYAEDFVLLAALGLTHHRLSIEWARIEPEPGVHDPVAVEHYRDVLTAARDAGITPWVCLHHFTLPRWFAAEGGFLDPSGRTGAWTRHVEFMAETFGDLAGGWQPVNETNYYARAAYGGGGWPPGTNDRAHVAIVDEAIQLATAEAARAPATDGRTGLVDLRAVRDRRSRTTLAETRALRRRDATSCSGRRASACTETVCSGSATATRSSGPISRARSTSSASRTTRRWECEMAASPCIPPMRRCRRSATGSGPTGSGSCSIACITSFPGTPLLVAEYGIGTDDDDQRAAYLQRGLEVTNDALQRGIDVRGFFHWTAIDNYEWLHGYDVSFGIIDADRNVRPSAEVLRREAIG